MSKNIKIMVLLFIAVFQLQAIYAQENIKKDSVLSLENCISKAMEGNFNVRISANNLNIAENNVTLAPFLPTVSFESSKSNSETENRSYDIDGNIATGTSGNNTLFSNVSARWTLFDGMAMFATREKQKELLKLGQFSFRSVTEELVMSISVQFFRIISLQNQVNLLQELVSISQQRYNQALTRYRIGSDSGLEYKQAKIYLNSDSSSLLLQKETLKNAYIELNRLMNVPLYTKYIISDSIKPVQKLDVASLLSSAFVNNTSLLSMKVGEKVSLLDTKIAKAERFPTLGTSAGYSFNLSQSPYFPSKYDEVNGLNWGLSLSIPIFKGGEINRRIRNSKLASENASLEYEQTRQAVESELLQLYNIYSNNLRMIQFEEESRDAAYLNLDAAMEKYKLGSLSGIEFRDFQQSYLNSSDRKLNALYQTKVSEITLRLLAGDLFKK